MRCGTPTENRVKVARKARNNNFQPNPSSSLESHPLAVLFNYVSGKYHQKVEVFVPLCATCKSGGKVEPRNIDFETRSMTFIGHRAWKEDLERHSPQK
jgi:hypothetical protein